jgi:polyisoprenoid-binding protein YceI
MTTTLAPSLTGTYVIDDTHSRFGFVARHAMVTKVRGQFNEFSGSGHFDAENPSESSVQVTLQTASVDTRNADRDSHVRSDDFFDVEQYPTIDFASTAVEQVDEDTFRLTGDLTIKDVTQPVTIELDFAGSAVDPFGNQRIGFDGSTTVNRRDFGLEWNAALDTGGVLVSEKVTLEFEISAIRADEDA